MNFPEDLLYTEDHEWVKIEGNTATVGITDYAQSELGDIVFVEIETEGEELESGAVFGTIEAVKTVADLYLPLPGKVTEKNEELEASPELVNESPYEKGWLIKVEITDDTDKGHLMDKAKYEEHVGDQ